MSDESWLVRDRDRERVWHELCQLGYQVRELDLAGDAQAVCEEMARRARRNIEVLLERFGSAGF